MIDRAVFCWLTRLRSIALVSVLLMTLGACSSCHPSVSVRKATVTKSTLVTPIVKGRVLIDPEFSGPERKLIEQAIRMWTVPLQGMLSFEISEDPVQEFKEMLALQVMTIKQERFVAGVPDDEDFDDPHEKMDHFDPRANMWDSSQGCNDRIVVMRVLSNNERIVSMEDEEQGALLGWTDARCHKKGILIVADRIEDASHMAEVVAHEIGHMLGIKHDFQRHASVMFPGRQSTPCVMRRDVVAFCERWRCAPPPMEREARFCGQ